MRVALLSKADAGGGGASRIARDLLLSLNTLGCKAHHYHPWGEDSRGGTDGPIYGQALNKIFKKLILEQARLGIPDLFPVDLLGLAMARLPDYFDIIHLHDATWAYSSFSLRWLSRRMPILWTFHDCSPFTAGCINPMGCELFKKRCGPCPQRGFWPLDGWADATRVLHKSRERLLTGGRVATASPSTWLADLAMSSGRLSVRPRLVWNGINSHVFSPLSNRSKTRECLGLPNDRPIILLAAGTFIDSRKGFKEAVETLQCLHDLNPIVLAVGNISTEQQRFASKELDFRFTGYDTDSKSLVDYYGSADLFLYTSLADNQPLIVLESMACGTPIVGFATGGVPEVVRHGVDGLLVPPGDVLALAGAVRSSFQDGLLTAFSVSSRQRILDHFTIETCADAYSSLYREVIENWKQS